MTTAYVVNAGEESFLDRITSVSYSLRLFTNDVVAGLTPVQIEALTASSFTEATFTGYAAKTLTGGAWVTTQDDPGRAEYALQTFTRTSTGTAQTVYGIYYTLAGVLHWFEYFDGPIIVTNNGDAINVTPRLTLEDGEDTDMSSRGVVGYREEVDNDGPYTADSVTDLAIANVPVVAGRRYAVHVHTQYDLPAASGDQRWLFLFRVNGATVDRFATVGNVHDTVGAQAVMQGTVDETVYWTPSVTQSTDDVDVFLDTTSGATPSITLNGASTAKRTLTVIDVGLA